MKYLKAVALILSLLFVVLALHACDGGEGEAETTTEEPEDITIKVSLKVKDLDGNLVYDIPEYTYDGKPVNPIELIDYYFDIESEETVVIDEFGTLLAVGSVEAGTVSVVEEETYTTYWWWSLNGKESTVAPEEYIVKDGDKIEYYLKRVSGEVTG